MPWAPELANVIKRMWHISIGIRRSPRLGQKCDPEGTQITTPTDQWRSQLGTWQTTVLHMLFFNILYQVLGKFFAHTAACDVKTSGYSANGTHNPMFLLWRRGSCRPGACPADVPALEAWLLPLRSVSCRCSCSGGAAPAAPLSRRIRGICISDSWKADVLPPPP